MNGICFSAGSVAREGAFGGDKRMRMEVDISEDLLEVETFPVILLPLLAEIDFFGC